MISGQFFTRLGIDTFRKIELFKNFDKFPTNFPCLWLANTMLEGRCSRYKIISETYF